MRLLVMLLLVVTTGTVQAGMNGKWSGTVNYSDYTGDAFSSAQNVYLFPYAENRLYLADSFWGYQLDMEISDGQILIDGVVYGTITDSQILISASNDECSWKLGIYLKADGKISFNDKIVCSDGYFDQTEGILDPSNTGALRPVRSLQNVFRRH